MKSDREMSSQTPLANVGAVVSVRGSVVDVRFDRRLPSIYSVLRTGDEGQIVIEVLAQRDAKHVLMTHTSDMGFRLCNVQSGADKVRWHCDGVRT